MHLIADETIMATAGNASDALRAVGGSISSEDDLLDIRYSGTTSASTDQPREDEENATGGQASAGGFGIFGDDIPGLGQYDDFHTIDWQRDIARDRMRHRHIAKKKKDSIFNLSFWIRFILFK